MGKKPIAGEQRVVLPNVSWQQFEQLLTELGAERTTHFTYNRGKLELMTPTEEHLRCHRLLDSLILLLSDQIDLPMTSIDSVLLKDQNLGYGTQPAACYYLRDDAARPDQRSIDLTQHPAPDLAVEIALNKSTMDKLPIYAALGISEVWRYVTQAGDDVLRGKLFIYQKSGDRYQEITHSEAFPFLSGDRILEFLDHSDTVGLASALQTVRSWLSQQGLAGDP
jgi:Uma2 family endonuclease